MKNNIHQVKSFILKSLKKLNSRYGNFEKNVDLFEQSLDSLDFMKLIFVLEKKYKIKINSKDFSKIRSVDKISKYVIKNI